MVARFVPVVALTLIGLSGCESSAPDMASPLQVPAGARLIAFGRFDGLVLSAPEGGTVYFVDDRSGGVVYALPYPPNEDPMRLSEAPPAFRSNFDTSQSYRIYIASSRP